MVEPHSVPATHAVPSGFLPQLVPMQVFPVVQSRFMLAGSHVPRHIPLVPHWNGAQGCVAPFWHTPAPLQRPAVVWTAFAQVCGMHVVPFDCR
jgi:hypothetical protein